MTVTGRDGGFAVDAIPAGGGEYLLRTLPPEELALRDALRRLVNAVTDYSPREDHDWRCEYRTEKVGGWKPGYPPVIRCECGFEELGRAVRDAADLLPPEYVDQGVSEGASTDAGKPSNEHE